MIDIDQDINEYPPKDFKRKRTRTLECNVIQPTHAGRTGIDFNGYGVSIQHELYNRTYRIGDKIRVEYTGEIGSPSFEIAGVVS